LGRGRVETSKRFRTSLFRSLLRGLSSFRFEETAKDFALIDHLQIFAEFLHGLGRFRSSNPSGIAMGQLRTTGLLLTALPMPAEPLRLAAFEGAAEPATALAFCASKTLSASALRAGAHIPLNCEILALRK
jgi:hypothetical protein